MEKERNREHDIGREKRKEKKKAKQIQSGKAARSRTFSIRNYY